jgi:hypothetical protein
MIGPMSLRQLVQDVDSLNDELTVFWEPEGALSSESPVYLVDLNEEDEPDGLREFIDVWHVRDVIRGKSSVAGLVDPDVSTKTDLLLDYAEKGA